MVLCRKNRPGGLKFGCGGGGSGGGSSGSSSGGGGSNGQLVAAAAAASQLPASCSQQAHLAAIAAAHCATTNGFPGNGNGLHDFHSAVAIGRTQEQQHQLYSECDGAAPVETAQLPNVGPTQVLPHLYIGSQADSLDADVMRRFGITHVINVSVACPQSQHVPDANFMRIPVNDGYTDKLLPHFQRAFNFLERVRETSGRCLVHCLAGISRSPTLSIAYTMMHCRMTQEEAYRFVKQRRQHISPNFNFLGQLLEFERQLRRAAETAGAPLASEDRPEAAKRQRTARSPSGALSQLTFSTASAAAVAAAAAAAATAASEASRRPRSVLLVPGGPAPDYLSASVRRSRSSDAFLAATIEADEGPVACLS